MTPIVLSKGIYQECDDEEIAYLEKSIREMVNEVEQKNPLFIPWPTSEEDLQKHADTQIQITFFPIDPNDVRNRLVMIVPLFLKEEGHNAWCVQMKDEFGEIELQFSVRDGMNRGRTI